MTKEEMDEFAAQGIDLYCAMNPVPSPDLARKVHEYQKEQEIIGVLYEPVIAGPTPFEWQDPATFPCKSLVKEELPVIWFNEIQPKLEQRGLMDGIEAGPCGFRFDDDLGYLDIYWGGYEYSIALDRIQKPEDVIGLLYHVSGKGWKGYSAANALALIDACAGKFGWRKWL